MTKTCTSCHETKPLTDFYDNQKLHQCRVCCRSKQKLWDTKNRAKKIAYNLNWRKLNASRRKAMNRGSQMVYIAKRKGLLIVPERCSRCPSTDAIEAAHTDYSKPLEVTWLCRPCHRAWDSSQPKTLAYAEPSRFEHQISLSL